MRYLALLFCLAGITNAALVGDVRAALNRKDLPAAEALIKSYRDKNGVTPEMLEAFSWFGRVALAEKRYDAAENNAVETKRMVLEQLKTRQLDKDPNLPIALGAAIEVQAHVLAARGERDQAVHYLRSELAAYRKSPVVATRTQKNIHLLSLEGKLAPALDMRRWISAKPQSVASLKGKPVLLFLWAHWCGDCKQQSPVLARIQKEFGPKELVVIAPTQFYGYAERGREVGPAEEQVYIEKILKEHYSGLGQIPVPLSAENFRNLGVSTTPTLILIGRDGLVKMYHPGKMTYDELIAKISAAS
jgi:thiol-disulfide isomerase/thioredoxin